MALDAQSSIAIPMMGGEQEFWSRFDAERARVLRRRIRWYCIVMLVLMVLSVGGTMTDVLNPTYADGSPKRTIWLGLASDAGLVALYAGALAYVVWRGPDRGHLVGLLVVVTVAAVPLASVIETLIVMVDEPRSKGGDIPDNDPDHATWIAATNALAPVFIACLLVPMRVGESLRMAIPATLVCVLVHALILKLPGREVMGWAAGLGAGMGACVLWSAWRYREMDARFQAHDVSERLREVSSELAYARRIHEALFPPPIVEGPVRVAYRYEPMREIGGTSCSCGPCRFRPAPAAARGRSAWC